MNIWKQHRRPAFLCLSLGNLYFLRAWNELFRMQAEGEAASAAGRALFWATILSIVILSAALLAGALLVQKSASTQWKTAARCAFLILLIGPLDMLCWYGWQTQHIASTAPLLRLLWAAILALPAAGVLSLVVFKREALYRFFHNATLIAAPLVVLMPANVGWKAYSPWSRPPDPRPAQRLDHPRDGRLVLLIFDELDYRLAFEVRPASIQLPALDRLRAESVFARRAEPPAMDTAESMLSYLVGDKVTDYAGTPSALSGVLHSGRPIRVPGQATMLSRARSAGFDSYIAGWYLPYCRALSGQVSGCVQPTSASIRSASIAENMADQWRAQFEEHWLVTRFTEAGRLRLGWFGWGERVDQYLAYRYLLREARRMAAGSGGRLVILHFPIPHPLGIYDRTRDELSLRTQSNSIDNLELVDQTVAAIRADLVSAGLWEATTLIVTSDHPMRPDVWKGSGAWSEEEARLTGDKLHPYIPWIVKLAGREEALEYQPAFSTVATADLALALLNGEVRSAEDVAHFVGRWHPSAHNEAPSGPVVRASSSRSRQTHQP